MDVYKARREALGGNNPSRTLNLDSKPPELKDNKILLLNCLICELFRLAAIRSVHLSSALRVQGGITNSCALHTT